MRVGRLLRRALLVVAALGAPAMLAAQDLICDPGDVEVRGVEFTGNDRFRDAELENAIATTASSWLRRVLHLPLGRRRCLDTLEFRRDAFRISFFYRQRGYYRTQVNATTSPAGEHAVSVLFRIAEGRPVIIDSLAIGGLDSVPNGARLARVLRPLDGAVFNRVRIAALIDTVMARLRNDGYARALEPLFNYAVDTTTNSAEVELTFVPGQRWRIGDIQIGIAPKDSAGDVQIDPASVRRLLAFEEGDIYRERDLLRSQRTLYQTEAYRLVQIAIAPDTLQSEGDSLRVLVNLAEAPMHSVRLGVGWATLDCFRTQGRFTHRNFLGGARRLELSARLSKIGIGRPLDGAESLCSPIRDDPFSTRLNYYASASFRPPTLFGSRNAPSLTLYSERRSEFRAYLRETDIGGVAALTREVANRTPITLGYQFEYGRTQAEDAIFCSIFNVCTLEDINRLQESSGLQAVTLTAVRDRTDNPFDPRLGSQARAELRFVSSATGATDPVQFNKAFGEIAVYRSVAVAATIAARVQVGGIFDATSFRSATVFVPPQERLYGGGPNSVRGFSQNQLGPVVYVFQEQDRAAIDSAVVGGTTRYFVKPDTSVQASRISPTGGDAVVTGSLELRWRGPVLDDLVQWTAFVDAGQVWNRPAQSVTLSTLRVTPGLGVRVGSPVGPLRLDVAYNGYESQSGAAYFVGRLRDDASEPRQLLCVSPGNTLDRGQAVGAQSCPETFAPERSKTFLSRLTFHFSIGQAF